jgi:hypothetical protein
MPTESFAVPVSSSLTLAVPQGEVTVSVSGENIGVTWRENEGVRGPWTFNTHVETWTRESGNVASTFSLDDEGLRHVSARKIGGFTPIFHLHFRDVTSGEVTTVKCAVGRDQLTGVWYTR